MHEFWQPDTLEAALAIIRDHTDTVLLAGGTDLYVRFRETGTPERILDLSHIDQLQAVDVCAEAVSIGTGVTFSALGARPVCTWLPALQTALHSIGSPQIRNRGTIGGSLCNASPAADLTPLWMVMEADIELARINDAGAVEIRRLPVGDFILGNGKTGRKPDEIATRLVFVPNNMEVYYEKIGRRNALSIARLSAAVALNWNGGTVADVRICAGAITDVPLRAEKAERYLIGKNLDRDVIGHTAALCVEAYTGTGRWRESYAYKQPALRNIIAHLLTEAEKGRLAQ